MFRKDVDATNG